MPALLILIPALIMVSIQICSLLPRSESFYLVVAALPSVEASWGDASWGSPGWNTSPVDATAGQWHIDDMSVNPASIFDDNPERFLNNPSDDFLRNSYQSWSSAQATWGANFLLLCIVFVLIWNF
jgi:hypothetical protein